MSALNVTIDPSIKGAWPEARLGCFIYTADVRAHEDSLWTCLENEVARTSKPCWRPRRWPQIPNLDESRKAYKAFGKDPRTLPAFRPNRCTAGCARARPSTRSTASWTPTTCLARETGFSLGSYDTARIGADIVFRLGKAGEGCIRASAGTTSRSKTCPCSQTGKARSGSPTSDSTRAMITQETRSCLTVVFSFSARSSLKKPLP